MKAKVQLLDQNTSNQIAAGEVVEKPMSVVKELVENALDAGATHVDVTIYEGGTEYIRVKDNGSGMDEENARLAVLRHATSKIVRLRPTYLKDPGVSRGSAAEHCLCQPFQPPHTGRRRGVCNKHHHRWRGKYER